MRTLTAFLIGFGVLAGSLVAAEKKPAPKKPTATKAKTKAKPKTTRNTQQHPTQERYSEIQQALADRGYLPEATGTWGADSVAALKKFQQEQGLQADGKLGALSLTALGLGPRHAGTSAAALAAGIPASNNAPTPLD